MATITINVPAVDATDYLEEVVGQNQQRIHQRACRCEHQLGHRVRHQRVDRRPPVSALRPVPMRYWDPTRGRS